MIDYESLATEAAGNWMTFESFVWHNAPDDAPAWMIINTNSRDSGLLEKSNASAIKKELSKFKGDVMVMTSAHWAVGWVSGFAVRVHDAAGKVTEAFRALCDLNASLSDYPCLDDEDYSKRQYKATCNNIYEVALRFVDDETIRSCCTENETWEGKVFSWLWENDQEQLESQDDKGGYPSEEACIKALKALGLFDVSMEEEV